MHSITSSIKKPFVLDRHRDTSDLSMTIDKKKRINLGNIFSFLSVFLYVARHFFCNENWLSSSYTRIQFIFSSARHTQLNGNMAANTGTKKRTSSHTYFFVRIKDYAFWCLSLSLFFFSLPVSSFLKECSTNFFFLERRMNRKEKERECVRSGAYV
jgi:hypothetical protein